MKYMTAIIISMLTVTGQAQNTVKITITGLPAAPVTDAVWIAGNFNNWNPQDESFRLQKDEKGFFFIEIKDVDAAAYEFKFTRGGWDKGETDDKGDDLPNRKAVIGSDTSLEFSIAGWKDGFVKKPASSTASAQVSIIDTAFAMPQLSRTRRIWIYLPKGYTTSGQKYPVLYMHDGQNLFDNATSFAGEWGIDEAMDSIKNACIVVGIDNGGTKRMNEYNPNTTKQFGKGDGKAYLAFIVKNLKPFIDKKYRTLPGKKHTYMAGSSMGGLISFYAGLYYPDVFGALGIFSSSFWIAPQIKAQVKQLAKKAVHGSQKYYFYAGGAEDSVILKGMQAVAAELKKAADPTIITVVNPQGKHNEPAWSAVFPAFYKWIAEAGIGH
jgi:predicted alpha/beta superfamily hydrolase